MRISLVSACDEMCPFLTDKNPFCAFPRSYKTIFRAGWSHFE